MSGIVARHEVSIAMSTEARTSEHTPGPWVVLPDPSDLFGAQVGTADGKVIAVIVYPYETTGWGPEDEANGRLIAAAPDLLQSLETIVAGLRSGMWDEGSGEFELGELLLAESAIAKARGAS